MLQDDFGHQLDVWGANEGKPEQKYAPDRAKNRDDLVRRDPLEYVGRPHSAKSGSPFQARERRENIGFAGSGSDVEP